MRMKAGILAALLAAAALQAFAQGYPAKPVHAIISFPPGSSTDIVGRIVMQKVSELWGQPVVPENRSGAGGSIASAAVARAAPDGYTLLINSSAHAVNPAIFARLPYDTTRDFIEVAPLTQQPNVLVVNASSPHKSLLDLVSTAKAKPGAVNFAHAGIGSGTHLNTERLLAASGIKVTQVPFKGTPADIVQKVSADVRKALGDAGVREKLHNLGNDTMDLSPAEFARFVRAEIDTYQKVITAAGIKPQ